MCFPLIAAAGAAAGAAGTAAAAGSTLATISTIASIGGTLLGAFGQIQQGQQQGAMMKYQAQIDRNNAIMADRQAEDALARGQEEERKHRIKIGLFKGQQINAFASNGVTVDSGTPLDVLGDTAEAGELEALTIRNNAAREAWGNRVQGANYRNSASMQTAGAKNAVTSGYMSAFSTALSGAGSVADRWYTYNRYGSGGSSGTYRDLGGTMGVSRIG